MLGAAHRNRAVQVLLTVVSHLMDAGQEEKLQGFLDAQPEALSIPFIGWLADMEAAAIGEEKQVRPWPPRPRRQGRLEVLVVLLCLRAGAELGT
jgi:hypothetical protein